MPALGNRSEIGMKAEPMMPKACSMPCICRTLMNASSVVIFMALQRTLDGRRFELAPRASRLAFSILGNRPGGTLQA
jgi:hypothetical protein